MGAIASTIQTTSISMGCRPRRGTSSAASLSANIGEYRAEHHANGSYKDLVRSRRHPDDHFITGPQSNGS